MEPNFNHFYKISEPVAYSSSENVFQQQSWWQKIKRLAGEHFILIIMFVFISTGVILGLVKDSKIYKKPETWVISQGLNSTLTKQQLLLGSVRGGKITLSDIAKVATASTTVKPEAVKIGKDYLLSTGADGKVEISVDNGQYKVEIIKLQKIDFTGVPAKIIIDRGNFVLNIGLTKGSGKILSLRHPERSEGSQDSIGRSAPSRMTLSLFQDKNGDGKKEENEPDLPWAGVTVKLIKI